MMDTRREPRLRQGVGPRRNAQAGLSLVELMVALAVIAIALFAMMSMIVHTQREKELQRELAIAKQVVVQRLEKIRVQDWAVISGDITLDPTKSLYMELSVSDLPHKDAPNQQGRSTCVVDKSVNGDGEGLVDVKVEVEWRGIKSIISKYSQRHLFTR